VDRTPLVAGNWKMNKKPAEALELIEAMLPGLRAVGGTEMVVCPPFLAIPAVAARLAGTGIGVGAQNAHWEDSGAFTGEISPAMLAEFCTHAILGHSERRAYFGETDADVRRRAQGVIRRGLVPIVCVGETLAEKEAGQTQSVVTRQMREGLSGLTPTDPASLVIAYEPVWAIGTGRAATGEGANEVIASSIRSVLNELFGPEIGEGVRVLYGGSVTSSNASEFFGQPEIDGALVGGASLKPSEFVSIAQAAAGSG